MAFTFKDENEKALWSHLRAGTLYKDHPAVGNTSMFGTMHVSQRFTSPQYTFGGLALTTEKAFPKAQPKVEKPTLKLPKLVSKYVPPAVSHGSTGRKSSTKQIQLTTWGYGTRSYTKHTFGTGGRDKHFGVCTEYTQVQTPGPGSYHYQ